MHKLLRASILSMAPIFVLFAVPMAAGDLAPGLYVKFDTGKGAIICRLFFEETPMTVANFIGLIEGKLDTAVRKGQPFYDGLTFHRVIKDFMIQGGDPDGNGSGGPGYRFDDEIRPNLRHDSAGILSMANAGIRNGRGTNGSQFFITHVPTPHLDGKHTVFGKVVHGQEVVDAIQQGDRMNQATVIRIGPAAEKFQVDQAIFDSLKAKNESGDSSSAAGKSSPQMGESDYGKVIRRFDKEAKTSGSGLKYVVIQKGEGAKPRPGQDVSAEYTGRFMDGRIFDTSVGRGPFTFKVGRGQVIAAWDEALSDMRVGEKRALIVPPKLGYGERGAGGVIPPNATLFFEVERLN